MSFLSGAVYGSGRLRDVRRRLLSGVAGVAAALLLGLRADAGSDSRVLDLRSDADMVLDGGGVVGNAGDVNGDDHLDVAIGDCGMPDKRGRVFVAFGPLSRGHFRLAELADADGFFIKGASRGDRACALSGAGDVNGDGHDDIMVGAEHADNNGTASGTVYVIFGSDAPGTVDLAAFDRDEQGERGYRVDGPGSLSLVGRDFANAGDVNGDGLADAAIASFSGSTYVVFGKTTTEPVDLASFDDNLQMTSGYQIRTPEPATSDLYSVAGAGDVNGDGLSDVIAGAIRGHSARGAAYVVYGKPDPLPVDVRKEGTWGFTIGGAQRQSQTGYAVAGVGDVNGDGFSDVVVGAPFRYSRSARGRAYVVYGGRKPTDVRLRELGARGSTIFGVQRGDLVGSIVAAANDVDGDDRPDLLVGTDLGDISGRPGGGSVFVIFGARLKQKVELRSLGPRGYRIDGASASNNAQNATGTGDVSGDGCDDVIVGGRYGRRGYLVWGC